MATTIAALSTTIWLQAAKEAGTSPISYLQHPIKRIKTLQVGDRTTANLAELQFNEEGTLLYAAVDHIGKALEDTSTHKVDKQLSINTLSVSDDSLARDKITRTSSSPTSQKFILLDRETSLSTSQQHHRFITVGDSENSKVATVNLWARDTASRPDGSMPMLLINTLRFNDFAISQSEMSADGDFVAIALQNDTTSRLGIADGFTGELTQELTVDSPVTAIAFSPDNKTLVTAHEDRTIYLRDVATGEEVREFSYTQLSPPRNQQETKVTFSNDGTLLAFGNTAGIHLWNIKSGKLLRTIALENTEGVNVWTGTHGLAISPDNQWIVSDAGHSNKMYIWQISTGKMQRIVRPGHTPVQLAFSPDGKLLASGDNYGEVSVWQLPEQFNNVQP